MSTATATPPPKTKPGVEEDPVKTEGFDPDSFRMTVGEHLEELRGRLVLSLMGLSVAVLACLLFSERVMVFFCAPLNRALIKNGLPPQMHYTDLTDPFMTYLKITMIAAGSIAGPWIIYQIWLFVAAGLYPQERKMVTKYIPLSVGLFITGIVFVYVLVLPISINFFIKFSAALNPNVYPTSSKFDMPMPMHVPVLKGDPKEPHAGDVWLDIEQFRLKVAFPAADGNPQHVTIRGIPFGPDTMMTPLITIGDYISLVITFMLTFGIAFQLPLVMLAVVSIGIVDITFLKTQRKMVFFGMTIASAFLAPGDIVTSMLALLVPMVILYEFGLILVKMSAKKKAAAEAAAG